MYLKFNPCVCLLPFSVFYYATYHSSLTFSGSSPFELKIRGVPPPLIFFASSARSLFCENAFLSAQCQKPIHYGYACVFNRSKQDLSVRMRADKANTAALSECRDCAFGSIFSTNFFVLVSISAFFGAKERFEHTVPFCGIIVADHFFEIVGRTDEDRHFFGSCNGGVKKVSGKYHVVAAHQSDDDDGEFRALSLVYAYRIGKRQVVEVALHIFDALAVVESDRQRRLSGVYFVYPADVAVEYARSRGPLVVGPL